MAKKGYYGLDVDFEYVPPELREDYAAFVCRLREALNVEGKPVVAALAPKTSAQQRGLLYEAHDYALLIKAANAVFLMTYEWGYVYGEPQAIAPLPQVRAVLDYALSVTAGRTSSSARRCTLTTGRCPTKKAARGPRRSRRKRPSRGRGWWGRKLSLTNRRARPATTTRQNAARTRRLVRGRALAAREDRPRGGKGLAGHRLLAGGAGARAGVAAARRAGHARNPLKNAKNRPTGGKD